MIKLTERKLEILQRIADQIDTEIYYFYSVEEKRDGIYLVPDENRWIGDQGEFMGKTFEEAKVCIAEFVSNLT